MALAGRGVVRAAELVEPVAQAAVVVGMAAQVAKAAKVVQPSRGSDKSRHAFRSRICPNCYHFS